MALKTTIESLKHLLHQISHDLEKSGRGNKAAAQRVRTGTIKFAKVAKTYRKESISEGSKAGKKKPAAKKKVAHKAAHKAAPKKKVAAKKATKSKSAARKR